MIAARITHVARCACGGVAGSTGECVRCRAQRLALSKPGDPAEVEAERIAERIDDGPAAATIHRQEDEEPEAVTEETTDDEEPGRCDESGCPARQAGAPVATRADAPPSGSHGAPLDTGSRAFMEQRLGHRFADVRVHTDRAAAESARRIDAHAYAVGTDLYFNEGRYRPHTPEGRRLLAHELVHVVQSGGARTGTVHRSACKEEDRTPCGTGACGPPCAKTKTVDDCATGAASVQPVLDSIHVDRSAHALTATFGDGTVSKHLCSPSTKAGSDGKMPTPTGDTVVGVKCGKCHTNNRRDGMAWFTGFKSHGRQIGFHDSQRVSKSAESHGCVRVPCSLAKKIHDHASSDHTRISVVK